MARVSAGLEGLDDVHAPAAAGALLDVLRGNVLVGVRLSRSRTSSATTVPLGVMPTAAM